MEFQELFSRLNGGKLAPPKDKKLWEDASDRISIHAKGIRPRFYNPRRTGVNMGEQNVHLCEERYHKLFENAILNRHPNEQEEHYNYRKSVYPLLAQEVYLNGKSQVAGSIFQNSQYTIRGNDERAEQYITDIAFDNRLKEEFFEHILCDPFGKFAVVETHDDEFGSDEPAMANIEIVESRYIMHYEAGESILFRCVHDIDGRAVLYFIDRDYCIRLEQVAQKKKTYQIVAAYEHAMNELPVVDNSRYLFKSYVTWADLIGRNFSDDEIVAKNNNYPHIQMVESVCQECNGQRTKAYPCETCDSGFGEEENCRTCRGRGTISVNPGEYHIIKESDYRPGEMQGGAGMLDRIKFINPDVAISKNSLERAQWMYEQGLKSLHLKHTDEAQSGTAKAIDREQLYLLISRCSSHIFYIADKLLRYVFGYLDMGISEQKPYTIEQPTQFQIKTEEDVLGELKDLLNADLSVRRQKTNEYMQIVYSGNAIELKKWDVTKVWDSLYCMTNDELNSRKLFGSATTLDFIKHDKVEVMLNMIVLDKGAEWFDTATIKDIVAIMDSDVKMYVPAPPVQVNDVNIDGL